MEGTHRFQWKWLKSDLSAIQKNGHTVFSCFSCGGGSSFGYKLAGYTVLGNIEIDPKVNEVYKINHHPQYNFLMDIRDFNRLPDEKIPKELFNLDILDGSPPCTTFSMAGNREKTWGKEKKFAEGQKLQTLDDLFFVFIETAKRLRPKIVVAENVLGILQGNAKRYAEGIVYDLNEAGYTTQIFKLDASLMGVPQKRKRVFFISRRNDLQLPPLRLSFNEPPIQFGKVREQKGKDFKKTDSAYKKRLVFKNKTDKHFSDIEKRLGKENNGFTDAILHDEIVAPTITAGSTYVRYCDNLLLTDGDFRNVSTFPQDYEIPPKTKPAQFIYGMSVPPVMMAHVAEAIDNQWLRRMENGKAEEHRDRLSADRPDS